MEDRKCYRCQRAEDHSLDLEGKRKVELRPYGPSGALVCFECGMSPECLATTMREFEGRLEACGPVVLLTEDGPKGAGRP